MLIDPLRSLTRSRWFTYGVAVVSPTAVLLLVWALQHGDSKVPLYPLFTLAVIGSALLGGLLPGLTSVGVSLLYVYIALLPLYLSAVGRRSALLSYLAFGGVGVLVSGAIGSLRRNREQLKRKETQLRTIINNLSERLYVCDSKGSPLVVNEAFSAFYPFKDPVSALSFWESVELFDLAGQSLPPAEWPLACALRGEQVHGLELRIRFKDRPENEFVHRYNASPVRDANGGVIMALFTAEDITLKKQAEEALIRSEKLAATGRMAATLAHELNNPLEAVVNAVYLASHDPALTPESRNYLLIADQELRRVSHMTQQTLGFYRENGSSYPVALPQLIDEVLTVYSRKLQSRNITVDRRYQCGPCKEGCGGCFLVNAGELRQIISNLLANGMDALRNDGRLQVRVSRVTNLAGNGHNIHLTFADNGCGIRVEHLKRIFEPFFTTKEAVGTGLGLWITQELVRKHNGSIKVRSRKDKGTVFRLAFPAIRPLSVTELGGEQTLCQSSPRETEKRAVG